MSGGWSTARALSVELLHEGEYVGEGEEDAVISDPGTRILYKKDRKNITSFLLGTVNLNG
jgi:hypothetical protein